MWPAGVGSSLAHRDLWIHWTGMCSAWADALQTRTEEENHQWGVWQPSLRSFLWPFLLQVTDICLNSWILLCPLLGSLCTRRLASLSCPSLIYKTEIIYMYISLQQRWSWNKNGSKRHLAQNLAHSRYSIIAGFFPFWNTDISGVSLRDESYIWSIMLFIVSQLW